MSEDWEKAALKKAYGEGYDDGRIEAYDHIITVTKLCLKAAKETKKEFKRREKQKGADG
jgi:hypothetical protein